MQKKMKQLLQKMVLVKVQSNIMRASTVFNLDQVELSNKSTFKVPQLNSGKQYSIDHN